MVVIQPQVKPKVQSKSTDVPDLPSDLPLTDVPDLPLLYENWQDARDYCQWAGQQIGQQWDLPTEAQWEFAARDRGENKPFAYDFPVDKVSYESDEIEGLIVSPYSEPVGAMAANKLGLYQMNGNASDLVYDWYAEGWPYTETVVDPTGINTGVKKVVRGGHKGNSPLHNTNFSRHSVTSNKEASPLRGWRCAQSPITLPQVFLCCLCMFTRNN